MKLTEKRSDKPEMMDNPIIDKKLLHKNLAELDLLNRYFFGHSITLQGVKKLINGNGNYHIVDIGCGSGDTLKYLAQWARKKQIKFRLTGIDKSVDAIQYLKKKSVGFPEIKGVVADYRDYLFKSQQADIYLCSLFCHHLDDSSLVGLLKLLKHSAKIGFVINDLHRNVLAYYGVWLLTRLLNGTVLSKNDGPVSVLRAFTRRELQQFLREAEISDYTIEWKWAFRYRVIVKNKTAEF